MILNASDIEATTVAGPLTLLSGLLFLMDDPSVAHRRSPTEAARGQAKMAKIQRRQHHRTTEEEEALWTWEGERIEDYGEF